MVSRGMGLGLSLLVLLPSLNAIAEEEDHNRVQQLRQQGVVLPLQQILAAIPPQYGQQILEVELEQKGGSYYYEVELVHPNGRIYQLWLDATQGHLIKVEEED